MEHTVSESLRYALEPKIVSCMAGAWATGDSHCLPLSTSVDIMTATQCRVVVGTIHNVQMKLETLSSPQQERWGILELTDKLSIPIEDTVFFLNTAFCSNERDFKEVVNVFAQLNEIPPYNRYRERFLKMEIFDEQNRPKDEETCNILRRLPSNVLHSCLPYLSGDPKWLQEAIKMGCPGIRIWCSDIGKGKGIFDKAKLKNAVALSTVPLILEGGLATPNDVHQAFKLGYDAVLLNSAFRNSPGPVSLAVKIREVVRRFYNEYRGCTP